uniref:Uncharacterized protein n=1 Tax=Chenopodium quinoa TaxID=63459 RepID=A0A803N3X7_CHEQI
MQGEYMEKLEEYNNKGIEISLDKVYLEVVDGQKKGKVYGSGMSSLVHHEIEKATWKKEKMPMHKTLKEMTSLVQHYFPTKPPTPTVTCSRDATK